VLLAFAALGLAPNAFGAAPAGPKTFDTSKQAADALVAGAEKQDVPALLAIFGPDGAALVNSGDEVQDRNDRAAFAELAKEKLELATDPKDKKRVALVVGKEDWTFPVPLVQKNGKWSFATKTGLREIVDRRVGSNELDAIEICHGYVEAQKEYASEDRDGNGIREYAQRVISTEGKRDGLFWKNSDGTPGGPIGDKVAAAIAQGYKDRTKPYHGYHFRVLKRQGPAAPGGAIDYVIDGKMIGGFALVAWPAAYRVSGVKTFMVSYGDVVYEKDLGQDTAKVASRIESFNPDKTWKATVSAPAP
jgi:hypothetical protein